MLEVHNSNYTLDVRELNDQHCNSWSHIVAAKKKTKTTEISVIGSRIKIKMLTQAQKKLKNSTNAPFNFLYQPNPARPN